MPGTVKIHAIYTPHKHYLITTDGDHCYKSSHHVVFMTALSQCCIINMILPKGQKWTQ